MSNNVEFENIITYKLKEEVLDFRPVVTECSNLLKYFYKTGSSYVSLESLSITLLN